MLLGYGAAKLSIWFWEPEKEHSLWRVYIDPCRELKRHHRSCRELSMLAVHNLSSIHEYCIFLFFATHVIINVKQVSNECKMRNVMYSVYLLCSYVQRLCLPYLCFFVGGPRCEGISTREFCFSFVSRRQW